MNRHRFRLSAILLLVASIFVFADLVVVPVLSDRGPACERINAWVSSQSSLPSTLKEISAYPVAYRRAIFGKLPPSTRAAIAKEHFASFLDQNRLTSVQKAVLQEVMTEMRPEWYSPVNESRMKQLEQKVSSVFAQKEMVPIFYAIGPERASYRGAKAVLIGMQESLRGMLVADAAALVTCECWVTNDCALRGGGTCNYTTSCTGTFAGCGFTLSAPCIRLCT